ncbi:MAG: hypothetical protein GY768_12555 [Planctomycetaceae bacterium]|nr:hypothetical protein [Planctomycetaceae bacterium]
MKRLVLVMILLVTAGSMIGCQSRGFGRRGAKCGAQPSAPSYIPGFNSQQQGPGCQGCNASAQSGAVMVPGGAVITEGAQTGAIGAEQFTTGPITDNVGNVVVDRQVVPGSVTMSNNGTEFSTVPGPESAPLPRS